MLLEILQPDGHLDLVQRALNEVFTIEEALLKKNLVNLTFMLLM